MRDVTKYLLTVDYIIVRSDTPSEGSESAGDDVKRPEVKRNRSLRALRRKKVDGEEETSLLERFKNTVTTSDPEKQRRKSIKRKQKEEVSLFLAHTLYVFTHLILYNNNLYQVVAPYILSV